MTSFRLKSINIIPKESSLISSLILGCQSSKKMNSPYDKSKSATKNEKCYIKKLDKVKFKELYITKVF